MSERTDDSGAGDRDASERTAATGPSGGVDGVPELDEFLSLLNERRRRYALYWLRDRDAGTVAALAERIAAERTDETSADVDEAERERIETKLVHVDIPKLAAAGLVSYDRRTGTIRFDYPPRTVDALREARGDRGIRLERGRRPDRCPVGRFELSQPLRVTACPIAG